MKLNKTKNKSDGAAKSKSGNTTLKKVIALFLTFFFFFHNFQYNPAAPFVLLLDFPFHNMDKAIYHLKFLHYSFYKSFISLHFLLLIAYHFLNGFLTVFIVNSDNISDS